MKERMNERMKSHREYEEKSYKRKKNKSKKKVKKLKVKKMENSVKSVYELKCKHVNIIFIVYDFVGPRFYNFLG